MEERLSERRRAGWERGSQTASRRRSNVSRPILIPLLLAPPLLLWMEGGGGGNFSIAEAVRQRTAERENKSAPVWSLVTTRGRGIVQRDGARERENGGGVESVSEDSDYRRNNVLLLYVPLRPAPARRLNLPSLI